MFFGRPQQRRMVLISASYDLLDDVFAQHRDLRRWQMWGLPEDLASLISLRHFTEVGAIQQALEAQGIRRDVAAKWPQPLGYRVVRLMAERERIAYALFATSLDMKRGARRRIRDTDLITAMRVEAGDLLAALRAAGQRLKRVNETNPPKGWRKEKRPR